MKKKYIQQDIDQFLSCFKELPNSYKLEKVHQLINNPDAKAMHTAKLNHKPLKFIIMTSAFIAGVTGLLCWLTPTETIDMTNQMNIPAEVVTANKEKNSEEGEILTTESKIPEVKPEDKTIENTAANLIPTDTTIDGQGFIISLSDAELQKLGFFLDETGIYYKNNFLGKKSCFHGRWESNSGEITSVIDFENSHNKKEEWSGFDFYPVATSTAINFTPNEFKQQHFLLMNDTLLPVMISGSQLKHRYNNQSSNLIIWLKLSDNLFSKLPPQYQYLQGVYEKIFAFKRQCLNADIVKYEAKRITEGLRLIEPSKYDLQKLGFVFKEDRISFTDYRQFEVFLLKNGGKGVRFLKEPDTELWADTIRIQINKMEYNAGSPQIELVFMSDESGGQNIQWRTRNEDENKFSYEYFAKEIQYLVPIMLRQKDYPGLLRQNEIFWFEPSMTLFDALPDSIGQQLKREYIYITTGNKGLQKDLSPKCIYFEACKSTFDMEEFKIYPNPANTAATIEFSIPVSSTGFISLVSISGTQLKFLVPTTTFPQGNNSFEINVSDVPPGIYLVFISTDNGFKKQRLIISR